MSYSKAFRHPHKEFVFKRALSSQDSSWSKLADPLGHDGTLNVRTDRCRAVLPRCLPRPFGGVPRWGCTSIHALHHNPHVVHTRGCLGWQMGQGKGCRAMQAICPEFKTFSEVLQWKKCVIVGILPFSGGKSSHQSGYVLKKIPENETTIFGTKVL